VYTAAGPSGRAIWGVGIYHVVAEIVSSNPDYGMDVVFMCCVGRGLAWADPPSKESYQLSKRFIILGKQFWIASGHKT
jgi:hypothetical protein